MPIKQQHNTAVSAAAAVSMNAGVPQPQCVFLILPSGLCAIATDTPRLCLQLERLLCHLGRYITTTRKAPSNDLLCLAGVQNSRSSAFPDISDMYISGWFMHTAASAANARLQRSLPTH
jgi:hypothetical protein